MHGHLFILKENRQQIESGRRPGERHQRRSQRANVGCLHRHTCATVQQHKQV
jgi:hypothetical protein